jgi:dipeptidyl aminopeptidase/acylaminoacyl peptidase
MIDEPTRIGDIWTWTAGETSPTRVTSIYDYLRRDFALPRQEQVEWKGVDGTASKGVLTYPIDYKPGTRYALVVQLHGGPEIPTGSDGGRSCTTISPPGRHAATPC